jgi:hypothetical protein
MKNDMVVTEAELVKAFHLYRHEHGDKWPVASGCGCHEWAYGLWLRLVEVKGKNNDREAVGQR